MPGGLLEISLREQKGKECLRNMRGSYLLTWSFLELHLN